MKVCKKCGIEKDESMFSKRKALKCGLNNWCKSCQLESNRKTAKVRIKRYIYKIKLENNFSISTVRRFGIKKAKTVYSKYENKCNICGHSEDLTIHHKDGNGRHNEEKKLYVNNDIENLELLCRSCHGRIHGLENKKGRKKK